MRAAARRESFNRRFWYDAGGYLYDVVDTESGGDDSAVPAESGDGDLAAAPRARSERWAPVMQVVRDRACSRLSDCDRSPRDDPDYKSRYFGDLRARDAAYHQGTVWAWLIGPFIDAWLRVYPDDEQGAQSGDWTVSCPSG